MKRNNILIVVVLALVAFLFMRNSQSNTIKTTSKTVGITPATAGTIQSLINGLVNIFGKTESAYSAGDIMV